MSGSFKLGLVAIGCFVAGILLGTRISSSDLSESAGADHLEVSETESTNEMIPAALVEENTIESGKSAEPNLVQRKISRFARLAKEGPPAMVAPFGGERLNPVFVLMFDLTDSEASRLEAALVSSNKSFQEIENQVATGGLSPDGKKIIVNVPPMPEAGGAVYDHLLDSFATVLGEDRFELFNAISRQSFDQRFDSFGLNTVTYELELPTESYTERTTFNIVRSYVAPNGVTTGSSTSRLNRDGLDQYHPVVVKFLPLEFR